MRENISMMHKRILKCNAVWFYPSEGLDILALLQGLEIYLIVFSLISKTINLLKPTGYVMHQQFNIQQLYALPTLYLCVLYLSEKKQRLVPLTA
jgi:hypothetical protein